MLILLILIDALGNNLYEAERVNTCTTAVDLTDTDPVVCVGSHILVGNNLSVAVLVAAMSTV